MTGVHPPRASVTVVVPAFNEEANIARLAAEVLREPWSSRLELDELIVVDDSSDDATAAIVERLAHDDDRVRLIRHTQRSGKNAGIRDGIAACRSAYVAILDADISLRRGCLVKTVHLLASNPVLAATSCINEPLPARTWRERASRFQALTVAELSRRGYGSLLRVYALRISTLDGLCLPDNSHDDLYIPRWLHNRGYQPVVHVGATAYIRSAVGLRDFAKQTIRTWTALETLERVLPSVMPVPARPPWDTGRAVLHAIVREPLGFLLYAAWRSIIALTPATRWVPIIDHSRHDTSTSTKDLGL